MSIAHATTVPLPRPLPLRFPRTAPTSPPEGLTRDGFFLVGTVMGRIRREFAGTDGKPTRYNITLAVQTESGLHRPERWSDTPSPSDVPERGERVVLPVEMTYYHGKGGTGGRLTWGDRSRGEEF